MFIDTHTHLYLGGITPFADTAMSEFFSHGGAGLIHVAVDIPSSKKCIDMCGRYPETYASVGIHPTSAHEMTQDELDAELKKLRQIVTTSKKIVAIGEIGRDHHWLDADSSVAERQLSLQKKAFFGQVAIAQEYDLPCIIHTRDCSAETLEWIRESGVKKFVVHCFSEDADFASEIFSWSDESMISFTCNITYPQSGSIREAASCAPLDRIMIETDTPFLLPDALKGESSYNEPKNVVHVLNAIQDFRNEDSQIIEKTLYENSVRFFGLPV